MIDVFFEYGIYGGPSSKSTNYLKVQEKYDFSRPLYIGDGKVDIDLCQKYSIDMLFLDAWTSLSSKELAGVQVKFKLSTLDQLLT